jgi:hypothetical protein
MTVCQWFGLKITMTVCQWFDLKITGTISSNLTSKPVVTISLGLASKSVALDFSVCVSKLAAMVWWFGPQNHRDDFLVYVSKSSRLWFIGCGSKPTGR